MTLFEPSPCFAVVNSSDRFANYAESRRDFALRQGAAKRSDVPDISLGQLTPALSLSAIVGAVLQSIGLVSGSCFPRKMALGDAPVIPVSARMRSLAVLLWRRAVDALADHPGDDLQTTVKPETCVPSRGSIRPNQALIAVVGENDFIEVAKGCTHRRSASKRVAVQSPSLPMARTPSSRQVALAAAVNRAYSKGSHVSLQCFRGQNPLAALVTLGGFVIFSAETHENKGTKQ